jgi:hypothetical protein
MTRGRFTWVAVFLSLFVVGCKQGLGERCNVTSDCDDGLTCFLPNGGNPQTGGTCLPPGGLDFGVDFAVPTGDLSSVDGAADANHD